MNNKHLDFINTISKRIFSLGVVPSELEQKQTELYQQITPLDKNELFTYLRNNKGPANHIILVSSGLEGNYARNVIGKILAMEPRSIIAYIDESYTTEHFEKELKLEMPQQINIEDILNNVKKIEKPLIGASSDRKASPHKGGAVKYTQGGKIKYTPPTQQVPYNRMQHE